jgi:hypothetical protein
MHYLKSIGQFLEIMTPSTDFKERITGEITAFIQNQAHAMSISVIERLVADLPALRTQSCSSFPR